MTSEQRQKIRFTGKRTGLESIMVKGVGRVEAGQQIEVDADLAERWTTEMPMADGKMGSDFSKIGSPYKLDSEEVAEHDEKQRERLADQPETEGETVEEFAESRQDLIDAQPAPQPSENVAPSGDKKKG